MSELITNDRDVIIRIFTAYYERMFQEQQLLQRRMLELMAMGDQDSAFLLDEDELPDEFLSGLGNVVSIFPVLAEAATAIVLDEKEYKEALHWAMDQGVDAMAWQQEMEGESPGPEIVSGYREILHEMVEAIFVHLLPDEATAQLVEVVNATVGITHDAAASPEQVFSSEELFCRFMRETHTREGYLAEAEEAMRMFETDELPDMYVEGAVATAKMQAQLFGDPLTEEDEKELRELLAEEFSEELAGLLAAQRTAVEMVYAENAKRFFGNQD